MVFRTHAAVRAVVVAAGLLLPADAGATSWRAREDIGVAAVDRRTGEVKWEAWRPEELPAGASADEKAAALVLLGGAADRPVPRLPDLPAADWAVDKSWLTLPNTPGPRASAGRHAVYYRHGRGVIAVDRQTKKELWRMLTNHGVGPCDVREVGDALAFVEIGSDVPATLREALAGGRPGPLAMAGLQPHTPAQRAAAAHLLHHYGDGYLRPEVRKLADQLREDRTDPAAGPAAKALDKLLTTWPAKRDRGRLAAGCAAALVGAADGNPLRGFGWPGAERVLTWCLLQELIYGHPQDGYSRQGGNYSYDGWKEQPVVLAGATRAGLAAHCRKVVADGPDREKTFAASVLLSSAVGWAGLTDAERKGLLLSPHPAVWRWAALALAKNGCRDALMAWARERPVDDHTDVIRVLRHDRPKDWADAELAFWADAARHNPGGVAHVLELLDGPAPAPFREPVLKYLHREAVQPAAQGDGQALANLVAALFLLDRWNDPADTPLFQHYLNHPGASTSFGDVNGQRMEFRRYIVREHARELLERRGLKVPGEVVYEEVVGPAKE